MTIIVNVLTDSKVKVTDIVIQNVIGNTEKLLMMMLTVNVTIKCLCMRIPMDLVNKIVKNICGMLIKLLMNMVSVLQNV
jgi:hypothetical protein